VPDPSEFHWVVGGADEGPHVAGKPIPSAPDEYDAQDVHALFPAMASVYEENRSKSVPRVFAAAENARVISLYIDVERGTSVLRL
jgi:hypothetical protein